MVAVVLPYVGHTELHMTMSVRLDPALESKVNEEARRLGITKSEFVKDAIERALGMKDPADLLKAIRSGKPMGDPHASENVSAKMRSKLRGKRSA
jgi:predicted DNA-binding protein